MEQSYSQAAKYYRLSSNQGLSRAQYELGCMYRDGIGVAQSNDDDLALFKSSAAQGYEPAVKALENFTSQEK